MKSRPAIVMPTDSELAQLGADPAAFHPPIALCGWRFRLSRPVEHHERLDAQALLMSYVANLAASIAGVRLAVEFRYECVTPAEGSGESVRIQTSMLLRVVSWGDSRSMLCASTVSLAEAFETLVRHAMPWCQLIPITTRRELRRTLNPWPTRELVEVRRNPITIMPGRIVYAPYGGVLDATYLLTAMAQTPGRTLLALRVEPIELDEDLAADYQAHIGWDAGPGHTAYSEPGELPDLDIVVNNTIGEAVAQLMLAYSLDPRAFQRSLAQRLNGLRQRAFRMQAQMAFDRSLDLALCTMLAGEVGGPGRLTVQFAWPNPDRILAGGAMCVRPRLGHAHGSGEHPTHAPQRGEVEIARGNLTHVLFQPIGSASRCPYQERDHGYLGFCPLEELADLGEVTRIVALPSDMTWVTCPLK